jgi:flagellin-like protein
MMTIMGKRYSRRGVSVIIASLLLIAIAVAAAVLLYVFSIGLMGSLGSSGGQQTKDQVILEAYSWNSAGSTSLTLYLKNVGSSSVNLLPATSTTAGADYFVNGMAATATAGTGGSGGCTSAVTPGAPTCSEVLAMPTGFTPTSGAAYPVKIVLPDGGVFSYTAIYGQSS